MESKKEDPQEQLCLNIISCLIEYEFTKAKQLVTDQEHAPTLAHISWDLIPKMCELVREDNTCVDGFLTTCEFIFQQLCIVGNVKELLLIYLEQVDRFVNHELYISLLIPLQTCLLRLPSRRGHSISLVLDTLYAHISTLPKPNVESLCENEKDRLLLDNDESVKTIELVLEPVLHFLKPFIRDCSWKEGTSVNEKEKLCLIKFLLRILDHPVAFLDLTASADSDNKDPHMRVLAVDITQKLSDLIPNFIPYLLTARQKIGEAKEKEAQKANEKQSTNEEDDDVTDDNDEIMTPPELGVSVLAYLIYGEHLTPNNVPQMMTYQYIFELNLPYMTYLMTKANWLVQEKGVTLFGAIVNCIPSGSVPSDFFGTPRHKMLLQTVLHLLCTGQNKQVNQFAVKNLTTLIWCFEPLGRYNFILFIFKKSKHSGVRGYCINQLKQLIDDNLKQATPNPHFAGHNLSQLLREVFTLPDGETTDLLDNSAQIMSALNFLRYLIMRDSRQENITGIWSMVDTIENSYCEKLRMGLNMSRAHFQKDLDNLRTGKKLLGEAEMEVSLGSSAFPGLDREQKIEMFKMALTTFDMMESVLGRVNELISANQK